MLVSTAYGQGKSGIQIQTGKIGTRVVSTAKTSLESKVDLGLAFAFAGEKIMLVARGGSGNSFNSDHNKMQTENGVAAEYPVHLRRLYLEVKTIPGGKVAFGSMGPMYGIGSDKTYLSGAGYILGGRVVVPFEKFTTSLTLGYLGDLKNPSLFDRVNRIGSVNYSQLTATGNINPRFKVGFDVSHIDGASFVRTGLEASIFGNGGQKLVVEGVGEIDDFSANRVVVGVTDILDSETVKLDTKLIHGSDQALSHTSLQRKSLQGGSFEIGAKIPGKVEVFTNFSQNLADTGVSALAAGVSLSI